MTETTKPPIQGYRIVNDINCGTPTAVGDAYFPKDSARKSAIMLIHGGGFRGGSRKTFDGWGRWFAARGYPVLNMDYILASPGNPSYPKPIYDIWSAYDFMTGGGMKKSAGSAAMTDRPDVIVIGSSAGSTLAAMAVLGMTPPLDKVGEAGFRTDRPKAAVCSAGGFEFLQQWEHDQLHNPYSSSKQIYLGGDPVHDRSKYYFASPMFYASGERAKGTKWLFTYGTMDDVCDNDKQSAVMLVHLKRAEAKVRSHPIVGAPHYWFPDKKEEDDSSYASMVAPRILTFFAEFKLDQWA